MTELPRDCVVTGPAPAETFAARLGLAPGQTPRIAFVAGPGDVIGTWRHWSRGAFDPRVPVLPYSAMFFSLVEALGAEALVLSEVGGPEASGPDTSGHAPGTASANGPIRFAHTPRDRSGRRFGFLARETGFSRRVARQLRDFAPHVVLIGTDAPLPLFAMLPRQARVVLTAHNTFWPMGRRDRSPKARLRQAATAFSLRRVASAICTSEECRRQVGRLRGSDRSLFVETPQVERRFLGPVPPRTTARRLLFAGRLEPEKGIFDLLEAFKALAPRFPDATLAFAGAGSAGAALAGRIAASGCADRVRCLGLLAGAEMHAALDAADLLVCPTRTAFSEGLALVVVEAAVHGVPSLLSSVVPAKDLMAGACAEFPADDTVALQAGLEALLGDPARYRRLAEAARARREIFADRSQSWGSGLYRALIA